MNKNAFELIGKLEKYNGLELDEYTALAESFDKDTAEYAAQKADKVRKKIYGNKVYIRGLIEISNICKNNCFYCGIRAENSHCERYRLTKDTILSCCDVGYNNGFRTFVMQGGEDAYFTDDVMCGIVSEIKNRYPGCAVTLSLGERGYDSFKRLYSAGADRYLLRHETASKEHYEKLHPESMLFEHRMECLKQLKSIGFQTGCGFMVGSPYQTSRNIAEDLKFIESFSPEMCGIGPFIPHSETPFANFPQGSADLTCYLVSLIRLIKPNILLPATTALGTVMKNGREKGIMSGANIVMPNLSPVDTRKKYEIYQNKLSSGGESAQGLAVLKKSMSDIGYEIVTDVGHIKKA